MEKSIRGACCTDGNPFSNDGNKVFEQYKQKISATE